MKKVYCKPFIELVIINQKSSLLVTISGGGVKPEGPDSGIDDSTEIPNGGNGDNQEAAKEHNAWSSWDD